jgi:phenylalanyl-tRNA synthetase beta chain
MKISEQWLREWVSVRQDAKHLAERLTLAGLEVGAVARVAPSLDGVVVGEIRSLDVHPQADRLRICQVHVGQKLPLTIVCGAANAAPGLKVPVALPGAVLPNGSRIAKTEIRGVESSGMLCSAAELGLEEVSEGLLVLENSAKPGTALAKHLQLDDHQLEIDLTPNRGDCLSIKGLARELAALTGARSTPVIVKPAKISSRLKMDVTLGAKSACACYMGRVVEGIDPQAFTPTWMKERLRRCELRSIHPVVDITNYVMLELGQPMHAFDLDCLKDGINARMARKDEALTLLDGKTISLDPADLVIADRRGPIALAGIMGGQESAVSAVARNIFLESAWFRPEIIGTRARHYGLRSESSHRFERGVDPMLQSEALERATQLVLAICGGRAGPVSAVRSAAHLPKRRPVPLRASRIERVLGVSFSPSLTETLLKRLGMRLTKGTSRAQERSWKVTPPSWRFDIVREIDLIEELARVHGYDKIPERMPSGMLDIHPLPETRIAENRLRSVLVDRDYQEAITYSFVDPALQLLITPDRPALTLTNPIASDLAQMRTTLWPGLIKAVLHNQNRQQARVRLFEIGKRFLPRTKGGTDEQRVVSGVVTGPAVAEQWGLSSRAVDYFDVKGDLEAMFALSGGQLPEFRPSRHPGLHPGQSADIFPATGNEPIGVVGLLHPDVQAKIGLDQSVIVFELQIEAIQVAIVPKFREISRFPAVRRDLAIVLADAVSAGAVLESAKAAAGSLLINLELFDEYRGEGIDSGRKSLALGLTFQDTSRTLNDSDVEAAVGRVINALKAEFDAQLRK